MAVTEFSSAIKQVATERGIPEESVLESIKSALATAYRKDYGGDLEEIVVALDPDTGEARILKDDEDVTPSGFGRIAAQTAKQVILQKIRETEKEVVMDEYKGKLNTLATGTIFRIENGVVIMDLGKAHGVLPQSEQVPTETYTTNQRLKVLVKDVRQNARGTEIIVSRTDPQFVVKLFEQEVPEITSGVVTIEAIAREPGSRTKMAVSSSDEKIDPVGSCVGQKGVRVQSIISELFGEKIDIVPYSLSMDKFIAAALSPAKVIDVELDHDEMRAEVSVPEDQQSLAIGKEGQNARLANKLTKWKIDIKGATGLFADVSEEGTVTAGDKGPVVGVWDAEIKQAEDDEAVEEEIVDEEVETKTETEDVEETAAEETITTSDDASEETEESEDSQEEPEVEADESDEEKEENEDLDESAKGTDSKN